MADAPIGLLLYYCYLFQNLRIETEKTKSRHHLQKVGLGEGDAFKYPKRLFGHKMGNKWRFSFPVFLMKLRKLLLQCLFMATVGIEHCLPPEAGG